MVSVGEPENRVNVLGPTTVGGVVVTPRQRALVAALALHGEAGACIEQLADEVWGSRPPAAARSSLQNQMTRLRRTHGEGLITCEQARYQLGAVTDVNQFERVLDLTESVAFSGDRTRALAHGLSLWRGTPFHDLPDSCAADIERVRLEALRADAVEELASARLSVGDFETAIVELQAHLIGEPYRDRAWELLIVAFHLSGRVAEALATHRRYTDLLQADLGASPPPHMTALVTAMQQGEPVVLDGAVAMAEPFAPHSARAFGRLGRARCRVERQR